MPVVWIENNGKQMTVEVPVGRTVLQVLQEYVAEFAFPCGGNHTCGKCLVEMEGALSEVSREEQSLIPEASGLRLACFARVEGDCWIRISRKEENQTISKTFEANVPPGVPLYPGEYGAAVDIGTTTVVAYLFRKGRKEPDAVIGEMNAQRTYGSDVLSRIACCDQYSVELLQGLILKQIGTMLESLCDQHRVDRRKISGCCITGNTTMLHIFAGIDPRGISVAPFLPATLFGVEQEVELPGFGPLMCYLPPCISAYVGGDISCSILASGIVSRGKTAILIDIGTNGEIALLHNKRLYCCSTAAGPAFEGANISCGMQAQAGAIDRVWAENGRMCYHVLGEQRATGICGSGLIDAVCAAKTVGLLDKKGRPVNAEEGLTIGNSGVVLTRKDLSELLLAKAAIRAGIDTLLHVCQIPAEEIAEVVLCGGFGSYLDVDSAIGIGLLPKTFFGRISSIGNAAGAGASMLLQNRMMRDEVEQISAMAETVELSASAYFSKAYVKSMNLN